MGSISFTTPDSRVVVNASMRTESTGLMSWPGDTGMPPPLPLPAILEDGTKASPHHGDTGEARVGTVLTVLAVVTVLTPLTLLQVLKLLILDAVLAVLAVDRTDDMRVGSTVA
jgi:hypothetical protein